jgi:hypothetical protein
MGDLVPFCTGILLLLVALSCHFLSKVHGTIILVRKTWQGEKSFSQWESQAGQWGRTVGDGVQFGCWDLLGPNLRETGFPASTSEHRTVLFSSGAESLSD